MTRKKLDEKQKASILLHYMTGAKIDTILVQHQINTNVLYGLLKKHNVPYKSNVDSREYFRNQIFKRLMKEGKTIKQVADELELPPEVVHGFVNYEEHERKKRVEREKKKKQKQQAVMSPKKLEKGGLQGLAPSSPGEGLKITQTEEEKQKQDAFLDNEDQLKVKEDQLNGLVGVFSQEEEGQLIILRELLRYASTVSNIPDYSDDPLLLPDYLLPVDVLIMKDMSARISRGDALQDIAQVHRTDKALVHALVEIGLTRDQFRDRYIKSLIRKGLIQL